MLKSVFITTAIILFVLSSPAIAQEDEPHAFFDDFVTQNTEYKNLIAHKAERIFRLTHPQCQDPVKTIRVHPHILLQPAERVERPDGPKDDSQKDVDAVQLRNVHAQSGNELKGTTPPAPAYGQWIERINITACGRSSLINQLIVAYTGETPMIYPLINGQTRLDPIDQPFAEAAIVERLKKLDKPCDVMPFTIDSNIIGYRTEDGRSIKKEDTGYGWFERWHIRACDTYYQANIAILPDPKTRYRYVARLQTDKK